MSYEKFLDALRDYYKLKEAYDDKAKAIYGKYPDGITFEQWLEGTKKNISEKKDELEKFTKKRKCINCKKIGGSIFTDEGNILKVVCGHKKPCNLHIELKKPEYYYLPTVLSNNLKDIKKIKQEIVEYKLDLLFGLQEEDIVLNEFKSLATKLEDLIDVKKQFRQIWNTKNNSVSITSEGKEVVELSRNEELFNLQQQYNEAVNIFKKNIAQYKNNDSITLLEDTLDMYRDTIIPIQENIRHVKYQEIYINETETSGFGQKLMPIYHLVPTKIIEENKIIWEDSFKIISNKK